MMASKIVPFAQKLPMVTQLDLLHKSIQVLVDHSVCPRCILRYLGIRDRGVHDTINEQFPMDQTLNMIERDPTSSDSMIEIAQDLTLIPSKRSLDDQSLHESSLANKENQESTDSAEDGTLQQTRPCSVCLGLLTMDFKAMAVAAHDEASQFTVSDKTFYLSMRLPPQLAIRHRSIGLFLKEELLKENSNWTLPDPIELKEIFRYLIAKAYSDHSGFEFNAESNFCLNIHVDHSETDNDYMFLKDIPESNLKIRILRKKGKRVVEGASVEKIQKAVGRIGFKELYSAGQCPPPVIKSYPKVVGLHLTHEPIFVAGRYNKWQRHISNSPWIINGKRLAEYSVEELVAEQIDKKFKAESHKFSSAGREDSDVLMLGRGRPFYLEIINPRNAIVTKEELKCVQDLILKESNGKVGVQDLQIVSRDSTRILKDSASTKSKSYTCLVKLSRPVSCERISKLSGSQNIPVSQRNPTRVPRRADIIRDKVIESLEIRPEHPLGSGEKEETDLLRVHLRTSAGTYVKEFVHGDGGRTLPSLATLLEVDSAECLELDVMEIHLDWPPALG